MFRHSNDINFKSHYLDEHKELTQNLEWTSPTRGSLRDREDVWISRYDHEKSIIIKEFQPTAKTSILELGPGPGYLGQLVIQETDCKYTYVDKIGAKQIWEERGYKGEFIVQNLMDGIDTSVLTDQYDIVVANDFLEHVSNPGNIVRNIHSLTPSDCKFLVSVPNWRMGHDWIYRGLFDYDNFQYFMYTHGWEGVSVYGSPLKTAPLPRISSEATIHDSLLDSWNWYFTFQKIK
jgi:2-polyprenyl-3-methyl-5-hydroxy-6-metoxy-1,4-benzoquinol methylase